jgi:hypothetical protein
LVDHPVVNLITSLLGQFVEKLPRRSPISFTKRMQGIPVSEVFGQAFYKPWFVQPSK